MNKLFWPFILLLAIGCSTTTIEQPAPPYEPDAEAEALNFDAHHSAEEQGFDPDMLAQIPAFIDDGYDHLFSVLVLRNSELVYEWYADDIDADSITPVFSVTKSVVSALIGIAIDEGEIESVDQTLGELIPLRLPVDADPQFEAITLRQLLTMTSGLYCRNDSCHDNTITATTQQSLKHEAGTEFAYDTGASHLLSAVLEDATGMTAYEYATAKLFEPLAFQGETWDADSEGVYFGGKGLNLRPRDMAKFGQLYLDEGEWAGEQLVSAEYVQTSTVNRLDETPGTGRYGYLWWPHEINGHDAYAAIGYGGQYITVIPDLELVVVITSNYWRRHENNDAIIHELIVPAIVQ